LGRGGGCQELPSLRKNGEKPGRGPRLPPASSGENRQLIIIPVSSAAARGIGYQAQAITQLNGAHRGLCSFGFTAATIQPLSFLAATMLGQ